MRPRLGRWLEARRRQKGLPTAAEKLEAKLDTAALGKAIKINNLNIDSTSANLQYFEQGSYNKLTGVVS